MSTVITEPPEARRQRAEDLLAPFKDIHPQDRDAVLNLIQSRSGTWGDAYRTIGSLRVDRNIQRALFDEWNKPDPAAVRPAAAPRPTVPMQERGVIETVGPSVKAGAISAGRALTSAVSQSMDLPQVPTVPSKQGQQIAATTPTKIPDLPQPPTPPAVSFVPAVPGEAVKGMLEPGNIKNLFNRPILLNPDGGYSTTSSKSFEFDGKETLIPTVIDGKRLTDDQAIEHHRKTGEHLGKFDTQENADLYAEQLHNEQHRIQGPTAARLRQTPQPPSELERMGLVPPPLPHPQIVQPNAPVTLKGIEKPEIVQPEGEPGKPVKPVGLHGNALVMSDGTETVISEGAGQVRPDGTVERGMPTREIYKSYGLPEMTAEQVAQVRAKSGSLAKPDVPLETPQELVGRLGTQERKAFQQQYPTGMAPEEPRPVTGLLKELYSRTVGAAASAVSGISLGLVQPQTGQVHVPILDKDFKILPGTDERLRTLGMAPPADRWQQATNTVSSLLAAGYSWSGISRTLAPLYGTLEAGTAAQLLSRLENTLGTAFVVGAVEPKEPDQTRAEKISDTMLGAAVFHAVAEGVGAVLQATGATKTALVQQLKDELASVLYGRKPGSFGTEGAKDAASVIVDDAINAEGGLDKMSRAALREKIAKARAAKAKGAPAPTPETPPEAPPPAELMPAAGGGGRETPATPATTPEVPPPVTGPESIFGLENVPPPAGAAPPVAPAAGLQPEVLPPGAPGPVVPPELTEAATPTTTVTPITPAEPVPMEEMGPRAPGPRWSSDPGAVPGEPVLYLDAPEGGDLMRSAGAIYEEKQHDGRVLYRGSLNTTGKEMVAFGPMDDVRELAKAMENFRDTGSPAAAVPPAIAGPPTPEPSPPAEPTALPQPPVPPIPKPKKQFILQKEGNEPGQEVVGTYQGKVVLRDGTVMEPPVKDPERYMANLRAYAYPELTDQQLQSLKPAAETKPAPVETPPAQGETKPAIPETKPAATPVEGTAQFLVDNQQVTVDSSGDEVEVTLRGETENAARKTARKALVEAGLNPTDYVMSPIVITKGTFIPGVGGEKAPSRTFTFKRRAVAVPPAVETPPTVPKAGAYSVRPTADGKFEIMNPQGKTVPRAPFDTQESAQAFADKMQATFEEMTGKAAPKAATEPGPPALPTPPKPTETKPAAPAKLSDAEIVRKALEEKPTPDQLEALKKKLSLGPKPPKANLKEIGDFISEMRTGEGRAAAGMDPRLMKVLGAKLYSGDLGAVAMREMLQNAIDAVRELKDQSTGDIRLVVDIKEKTLDIDDNGLGMVPDVATKELLDIGGSKKGEEASGGFGIAKVALFANAKTISITTTARDASGKVWTTRLNGSGEDWANPQVGLKVETIEQSRRKPTGTSIRIRLNDDIYLSSYEATRLGERTIRDWMNPAKLTIVVNEQPAKPKVQPTYTKMFSTKSPGGTFDVYVGNQDVPVEYGAIGASVSNRGLYQFEAGVGLIQGSTVKSYTGPIVINILPEGSPEDPSYPFSPDRDRLTGPHGDAMREIRNFVQTEIIGKAVGAAMERYKRVVQNAPFIGESDIQVIDTAEEVQQALVEALTERAYMEPMAQRLADGIIDITDAINAKRKPGISHPDFAIGLGSKYLGLNVDGESIGHVENLVLVNPYTAAQEILALIHDNWVTLDEGPSLLAEQMAATVVHELTHQSERGHDTEFAGALTRNLGVTAKAMVRLAYALEEILTENNYANWSALVTDLQQLQTQWGREDPFSKISSDFAGEHPAGGGEGAPERGAGEGTGRGEGVPSGGERPTEGLAPGARPERSDADITGLDDSTRAELLTLGSYQYQATPDWDTWSKEMAAIGDWVTPYLPTAYDLIDNVAVATGQKPTVSPPALPQPPKGAISAEPEGRPELPTVPGTGEAISGEGPAETGGTTPQVGGTGEGAGPAGGTGAAGAPAVPEKKTRPRGNRRTGDGGTDARGRGGIDNSGFYRITDADEIGAGGPTTKFRNNIKAIRVLKSLMTEGRLPTEEERQALARYVGWGGLSEDAFAAYNRETGKLAQELEQLLTPDEYRHAKASVKNAHFTAVPVVRFMWDLAKRLGFTTGTVTEPAMGVGTFFGLAPDSVLTKTGFIGVELDPVTGNIAKYLYPGAKVLVRGFETVMLPDNSIDLFIGNVPFGDYGVYDSRYKDLKLLIHDYFFVKSLDKVKPGGLIMFITSKGTMDKVSTRVRELLADQADLVAAYRLPETAFMKNARTQVTTDIIILQKREAGALRSGESFIEIQELEPGIRVNEYFVRHPENMFGKMTLGGTMYRGGEPTLEETEPLETLMAKALSAAPQNVVKAKAKASAGTTPSIIDQVAPDNIKELAYTMNEKGQLVQRINGILTTPRNPTLTTGEPLIRMLSLIALREQVKKVIATQLMTEDDVPLKIEQTELNKLYDKHVARHGILNGKPNEIFDEDPQYPLLLALENYTSETKSATKSDIFTKRTIRPVTPLEGVSADPKEALFQVLSERGYPDMQFLAQLADRPEAEIVESLEKQNLIFKNPETGTYELAAGYLSGYVREKLAKAIQAAEQNPEFQRNVEALQAVQPPPIPMDQISVKLGAIWVPINAYRDFIRERIGGSRVDVLRLPDSSWRVDFGVTRDVQLKWGSDYLSPDKLIEQGMNMRRPTIWREDADGNKFVDQTATVAAREKLSEIKREFEQWAQTHTKWSPVLHETYNREFNGIRLPEHDGQHLILPGVSSAIALRPHQLNAIQRIIADGRALLAHVVGSGKTYTMIAAGMELRRLGISKKNMYVVPNGKVEQWRAMFQRLYPAANILAVGREDLGGDNRRRSISRIATGDWDAVILQHSSFSRIPISPELLAATIQKEMDELEETLMSAKVTAAGDKRDPTVKALEKAKSRLEDRLKELADAPHDDTIKFDELGVDYMFVDEAHEFKNLTYYTKMGSMSGLSRSDTEKGLDLKSKTDFIQERNKGRGIIFATGTPISNSMAEAYNMTRYVAPDIFEKAGIRFFDDWAANFGDVVEVMELSPDGRTYRPRAKFAQFTNAPELITMFRSFTDVKHAHELNLPTPELEGGQPQPIKIRSNEVIEPIFAHLLERAESLRANPRQSRQKGSDNWLTLTGDGKKIALDARLYDASLPDHPESKSNVAVQRIFEFWEKGKDRKTTQVVFADNYQTKEKVTEKVLFNLYKDMRQKLIAKGVPAKEIAIAHDFNKDEQIERMQRQVNAGEIRILFGSTAKLGVGINIQERLAVLHDLDAPWRPDQLEQRHGRIVRQGNMHMDWKLPVRIFQYVTEKSFDAYIFQALETKARFIRQIMSGNVSERSFEDAAGDVVLQYAELKAIASGNPDVKLKMELDMKVGRLEMLEVSYLRGETEKKHAIAHKENELAHYHTQLEHLQRTKAEYDAYRQEHPDVPTKQRTGDLSITEEELPELKFDANLGGVDFTSKQELVDYIEANKELVYRTGALATLYGVPVRFETIPTNKKRWEVQVQNKWIPVQRNLIQALRHGLGIAEDVEPTFEMDGKKITQGQFEKMETKDLLRADISFSIFGHPIHFREADVIDYRYLLANSWETVPDTAPGLLQSVRYRLNGLDQRIAGIVQGNKSTEEQIANIRADMGKPFQYRDDLHEAREQLAAVNERLIPPPETAGSALLDVPEDEPGAKKDEPAPTGGPATPPVLEGPHRDVPRVLRGPNESITVGGKTYESVSVNIPIQGEKGIELRPIQGWQITPGLAVTQTIGDPKKYTVTHVPSGLSFGGYDNTLQKAVGIASRVATVGDWTRSKEQIDADLAFKQAVSQKLSGEAGVLNFWRQKPPPPIQPNLIPSQDSDMRRLVEVPRSIGNIWTDLREFPSKVYRFVSPMIYNADIQMWPIFAERIRRSQELASDAARRTTGQIEAVLKGLHPVEYDLFHAVVFWEDMYETLVRGEPIPLQGTNAAGQGPLVRIDNEITRLRSIATPTALDAIDRHHQWMEEIFNDLVQRGKVDPNQGRVKYFPNMVMRFADGMDRLPGLPLRMQTPRRLYLKQRKGHILPHDPDYIRVMEQYGTRVYLHNMIDDFIDNTATEYDLRYGKNPELPHLTPQELVQMLAATGGNVEPDKTYTTPDGRKFKGFQFTPGRVFYPVRAINEDVIQDALNAGLDELIVDIDALRQALLGGLPPSPQLTTDMGETLTRGAAAVGQQHKVFLLPIEVTEKLKRFRESNQLNPIGEGLRVITKAFKLMALHSNPLSWQMQNIFSNELGLMLESLDALGRQKEALDLLRGKLTGPQHQNLMEMIDAARIWNSSFVGTGGGVGRAINAPGLQQYRAQSTSLLSKLNPFGDNPIGDILRRYEQGLRMIEAIPKVANFLENYDRVQNGQPVKTTGVSLGGLNPLDELAVGRAARQQNIDYGATAHSMQFITATLFPFLGFYVKTLPQVLRAAKHTGKFVPGDEFLLKILSLYVVAWLWNHLLYPETEDKLDWQKETLHLNTPYVDSDGKPVIWSMQTPYDVAAQWIGINTLDRNMDKVINNQWTLEQAARQQLEDMFGHQKRNVIPTAAGGMMEQLFNPILKAIIDIKGNRDSFTGQEIVSKDQPNLWGTLSKAYPDNPAGQQKMREYLGKKIVVPYMQFLRAQQMQDPDSPIVNWITETGPLSLRKALGFRSVDTNAVARGEYYDHKNWERSMFDVKQAKLTELMLAMDRKDITEEQYQAEVREMQKQPGVTPSPDDMGRVRTSAGYQIARIQDELRKTTDPQKRRQLLEDITTLRRVIDIGGFRGTRNELKVPTGLPPVPLSLELPPVPQPTR